MNRPRRGFPLGLPQQSFVLFLFFVEVLFVHRDAELSRLLTVFDAEHPHGTVPPRSAVLLVLNLYPNEIAIQESEIVMGCLNVAGKTRGPIEVGLFFLGRDGRVSEQNDCRDEDRARDQFRELPYEGAQTITALFYFSG
jgi:hypothetical protein